MPSPRRPRGFLLPRVTAAGAPGPRGSREHDIVLLGEDGAENITGLPLRPEHNIVKA